jgi:hypothetical protein
MKKEDYSPNKRRKLELAIAAEEQGEWRWAGQPFEQTYDLAAARPTFRIVTIDGGTTLNAELPIPRLTLWVCVLVQTAPTIM